MPRYQILAVTHLDSKAQTIKVLFETRREETFETLLENIQRERVRLRGFVTPKSGRNARPVICLAVADPIKAAEAHRDGYLVSIPTAGSKWPSVRLASDALGLAEQSLRQLFYNARKENNGTDTAIRVRGLLIEYLRPGERKLVT